MPAPAPGVSNPQHQRVVPIAHSNPDSSILTAQHLPPSRNVQNTLPPGFKRKPNFTSLDMLAPEVCGVWRGDVRLNGDSHDVRLMLSNEGTGLKGTLIFEDSEGVATHKLLANWNKMVSLVCAYDVSVDNVKKTDNWKAKLVDAYEFYLSEDHRMLVGTALQGDFKFGLKLTRSTSDPR